MIWVKILWFCLDCDRDLSLRSSIFCEEGIKTSGEPEIIFPYLNSIELMTF
jgi:hypothetical protein